MKGPSLIPKLRLCRTSFQHIRFSTAHVLVDSFARKAFSGNPAAVVFSMGKTQWMQDLAKELNVPVTAFVGDVPGTASRPIRWFTPKKELTICGHATLAAAHTIFSASTTTQISFHSEFCGDMVATKSSSGAIQFTFPADTITPTHLNATDHDHLISALSIEASDIFFIGRTDSDLVVELTRQSFSRIAQIIDYTRLAALNVRGIIITCRGKRRVPDTEKDTYHCVSCGGHAYMNDQTYDYLLRAFYPSLGLPEDQATGSAQCVLAPYYFQRYGLVANATEGDIEQMTHLTAYQASQRGGTMQVALVSSGSQGQPDGQRIVIAGRCVTIMQSTLSIPVEGD